MLEDYKRTIHETIRRHDNPTRAQIARKFFQDEMTPESIAMEMGIPRNTVYSHLRRFRGVVETALRRLADCSIPHLC